MTALHVVEPWVEMDLEARRQDVLTSCADAARWGVPVDVAVDVGDAVRRILDRAASLPADLIVMGTHGMSGFEHLVMGSVTETVLRKSPCPVLTVPPRAHEEATLPFTHLLCAVDWSDTSLLAARFAFSLAAESGASVTLLHAIEWPWHEPPAPSSEDLPPEQRVALATFRHDMERRATLHLESMVPAAMPRDRVRIYVTSGTPYERILDAAADANSDLIVLGVASRNRLSLTMLGSTANHVVRAASCPVLTVRKPAD